MNTMSSTRRALFVMITSLFSGSLAAVTRQERPIIAESHYLATSARTIEDARRERVTNQLLVQASKNGRRYTDSERVTYKLVNHSHNNKGRNTAVAVLLNKIARG